MIQRIGLDFKRYVLGALKKCLCELLLITTKNIHIIGREKTLIFDFYIFQERQKTE